MEYYSAIKKNEILPLAVMWMDLRNIMFSEISQTEKDKLSFIMYIIIICGTPQNICIYMYIIIYMWNQKK